MAEQKNNNQQNNVPIDPFTQLMWGPPPGTPPFMPFQQPANVPPMQQNQGQEATTPTQGFMDANGNFDFNKIMDGADKMFKLINQTQPMIKQLGPLFNLFKK